MWHLSIQLIIVCVYIALLFGISFYVKRRADKGSTEYLFAGRKLSASLIAVNITGLAVGAASTVGVAENAFKVGMAAGWYNAAWAAGAVVMGLVAAGKLRAMKISTIPEFFEKYYDTKGRVISAVGLVIIMSVITALQYLAGGAILASLLPDIFSFKGGMMMSAVVFIGITLDREYCGSAAADAGLVRSFGWYTDGGHYRLVHSYGHTSDHGTGTGADCLWCP